MASECANPLWLEWIGEWLETARERSLKTATSYKKAYESLKACPLEFTHPSEVQTLHGFGPRTCEKLEQRLKQHCEENGLPMPKRRSRKRRSGDLEDEERLDMTPAKKPRKTKKPYVPSLRSGPYGLLLALSSIDQNECVSKQQLIQIAQPYCDSSFTATKDTTTFYTAWNSMKTLVDKDLVKETSRPQRKYSLTDEGWEVAEKIKRTINGVEQAPIPAQQKTTESAQESHSLFIGDEEVHIPNASSKRPHRERAPIPEPFNNKVQAPSEFQGQRLGGVMTDKFGTFKKPPDVQYGQGEPAIDADARLAKRLQAEENAQATGIEYDFVELLSSPEPELPPILPHERAAQTRQPPAPVLRASIQRESEPPQQDTVCPDPPKFVPPDFQPIRLQTGSFTVELVLDNREIRSREDRSYIEKQLIDKGVRPLLRALPVGDFFWVAKCRDPHFLLHHGEEGDEIALDYIIERKRLDDLISSIKDGRFQEQKFRLRRSGVKNVVYLIEDIGISNEVRTKYYDAVQSAIASTQVVNGYFVKRTKDIGETIRYLARMTRMLKGMYETKPLAILPSSILNPQTYLHLLSHLQKTKPFESYNITYPSFSSLSSKSDGLTLRDVFLRMLMTAHGLTGDKALEIQKHWRTPREFIEAFGRCRDRKEKEGMVERRLGDVVGRGKVQKALSVRLAEVWGGVGRKED